MARDHTFSVQRALFSFLYLKKIKISKIYVRFEKFQKYPPVAPHRATGPKCNFFSLNSQRGPWQKKRGLSPTQRATGSPFPLCRASFTNSVGSTLSRTQTVFRRWPCPWALGDADSAPRARARCVEVDAHVPTRATWR